MSAVVLSDKVAAFDTLDTLEFESNTTGTSFDVGKFPSAIGIDEYEDTVYVANSDSDSISVIDGETLEVTQVPVGEYPISIAIDWISGIVYVANFDSDDMTVIDGETLDVTQVPAGKNPNSIAVNAFNNTIYLANFGSDNVSVIDGYNFTNTANVIVDCCPTDIAVDEYDDTVYVTTTNEESDSISAIDNDTLDVTQVPVDCCIFGIAVDEGYDTIYAAQYSMTSENDNILIINDTMNVSQVRPVRCCVLDIAVDDDDGILYVANSDRRTVDVMNETCLDPLSGVSFNANPFHAGHIECNDITVPINQYFYVDINTSCKAKANKGFEFLSWEENLDNNSTHIIKASQPASSLDSILDFLGMSKPEEHEATISITKFGTFTANFKGLPPAIPPEYLATLFAVVISAFVGSWLAPTFIEWRKTKKHGNRLDYYHERIKDLSKDGKLDKNDLDSLDKLRDNITDEYARDKINREQFDKLVGDISISYQEIFRNEIDSMMTTLSEEDKEKRLNEIETEIEDLCAKGKISELHYNILGKRIEFFVNKLKRNK
jgi:YVTN family beta-propeller protein